MRSLASLDSIVCDPQTHQQLTRREDGYYREDGKCFPVKDGIVSLVYPEGLAGSDAKWNRFYDSFAPFYSIVQHVLGRLLLGENVAKAHRKLVSLIPILPGCRLLEVSPGPGTFHRYLRERLGKAGLLVSLDLSAEMLRQCKKRGDPDAVLFHGNGQHLPFADGTFDVLFHFGGINLFNDPNTAIAEFIRVVRKGGIVCWGDEGFSPNYPEGRKKKILTRMNPGYLKPRPPIPSGVEDVVLSDVYGGTGYLVVARKK
jgi:ubiquinone/menaquinone biosynthesis C-methylase UbiE